MNIQVSEWVVESGEHQDKKYINYLNVSLLLLIDKKMLMFHFSVANWTPKLNNQSFVESELAKAFKMWSDYSRLEFVKSDDYYGSDIVIAFGRYSHGDSYPFDGPGHNGAKAFIKSYL